MQSARELVNRVFEKPPYIIEEGILNENSLMVIGGPPKSYKSFFTETIALHLATGTNLFGATRMHSKVQTPAFNVVAPQRILMLEQEIGDWSLKDRILAMASSLEEPQKSLFLDNLYTHSCDRDLRLDSKLGTERIADLMNQVKPQILILDPLIEFHEQDENSSQAMINVMRNVDKLRDNFKCGAVLDHHAGKSEDRHGPDSLRGSSAIYGKGDSFFMLEVVNRPASIIKVTATIRRDIPIRSFMVRLDWQTQTCKFHDWCTEKTKKKAKEANPDYDENVM